jgi:hypothetical protein
MLPHPVAADLMSAATPSRARLIILGTRLFAEAVCAIGVTKRAASVAQVEAMGFWFATAVHPTARISRTARVATAASRARASSPPPGPRSAVA